MTSEPRGGLLKGIDNRTKVLALICLIAEALFLASLPVLPADQTLYALITCAVILLVMVVGIVFLESRGIGSRALESQTEIANETNYGHLDGRRKALIGRWTGTLKQQLKGEWTIV